MTDKERTFLLGLEECGDKVAKFPSGYHYTNTYDFVCREGRFFQPRPLPDGIKRQHIMLCYSNALRVASKTGFAYVEGNALSSNGTPHLHAWNASPEGFVIDTTWEPVGSVYLGVIFPLSLVRKMKGPVIDAWQDGYPILREKWKAID